MWRYWFKQVPKQLSDILKSNRKGTLAEDLRLGVATAKCPANTVEARALYGGAL